MDEVRAEKVEAGAPTNPTPIEMHTWTTNRRCVGSGQLPHDPTAANPLEHTTIDTQK